MPLAARIVGLVGLVAQLAGCDPSGGAVSLPPAPLDRRADAIVGGEIGFDDNGVVAVWGMESPTTPNVCSGALISPRVVLTARHCVAEHPGGAFCDGSKAPLGPPRSPSMFHVTHQWSFKSELNAWSMQPETWKVPSEWPGVVKVLSPTEGFDLCGYDLAVLVLDRDIPLIEPLAVKVDGRVEVGQGYSAVGYGLPELGVRRRLDGLKVECVDDCELGEVALGREWAGTPGIKPGDSGSPALDEQNRVIGVASRGGKRAYYEDVYVVRDWLRSTVLDVAQKTNTPAPAWALAGGAPLGTVCTKADECSDAICVDGGSSPSYCSRPCDTSTPCPKRYACSPERGHCVKSNDFGQVCATDAECNGGVCLDSGTEVYCTRRCNGDTDCPGAVCAASGLCEYDREQLTPLADEGCALARTSSPSSPIGALSVATIAALVARRGHRRRPAVHPT